MSIFIRSISLLFNAHNDSELTRGYASTFELWRTDAGY